MSFIAVGGTLLVGGTVGAGTIAAGAALAGTAANLYGANQQQKANAAAQQANQNAQTQQNNAAWSNYLMTRGIAPTTPVTAGVIPSAGNFTTVNSRLPLWATVSPRTTAVAKQPFLVKKGAV